MNCNPTYNKKSANFQKPLDKMEKAWYTICANEERLPASTVPPRRVRSIAAPVGAGHLSRTLCCAGGMSCVGAIASAHYFYFANTGRCVSIGTNAKEAQTLINEAIEAREVRVVNAEGQPLGIMSSREALKLAYEKDLDLVLIAPQAQPPVCKIMDYGKFCFEKQKREKEAKKKQQTVELKEIQLSCRIDTHDYETKLNQARKFLTSGNKVRVVMRFRGREMSHMSIGRDLLDKFLADTQDVGVCDKKPVLDGRFMSMVINPVPAKAK